MRFISRILYFRRPDNGDFTNGQAAEKVIGQPDFFTVGRGTAFNRLSSPRHIAIDTDNRLYVADAGNNRVVLYNFIRGASNDPSPAFTLTAGLNNPQGVWVSPLTGEIWVANSRGGQATVFQDSTGSRSTRSRTTPSRAVLRLLLHRTRRAISTSLKG